MDDLVLIGVILFCGYMVMGVVSDNPTTIDLPAQIEVQTAVEPTLDDLFLDVEPTGLPERQCDIVNCPFSNEDFYISPQISAEIEENNPSTLEEAYMTTKELDRGYDLSCGKSSLILIAFMDEMKLPCNYKVYHIVNLLTPSTGHSFIGLEKDGKYLILDPLNCHGDDMMACIESSTENFYNNKGVTRKDKVVAYQLQPYVCRYKP